jgi:hypothetical protein
MTLVCAWCDTVLGTQAPFHRADVTHGMCARCLAERLDPRANAFAPVATDALAFASPAPAM